MLFNLGSEALSALVSGIPAIAQGEPALPKGYDRGVLIALRAAGKRLGQGVDHIVIEYHGASETLTADYTASTHQVISHRLKQQTETLRTFDGQLLIGDFKPTSLRCRIHPPLIRPIVCSFPAALQPQILAAMTRYVRVTGETHESEGVVTSLVIHDVRILGSAEPYLPAIEAGSQLSAGWELAGGEVQERPVGIAAGTDLATLIKIQGVGPVGDFASLRGDYWPDDESADVFAATIRQWRHDPEGLN
jgi:hypothetical protein